MESKVYIIAEIEGEYAYLADESSPESEKLFIAMALLPAGVDVGDRVLYRDFTFEAL